MRNTGVPRRTGPAAGSLGRTARAVAVAAACAATMLAAACSAGQRTQTGQMDPSIPGVNATSPDGKLSVRDVMVAYKDSKGYPAGGMAPLVVRVFNNGDSPVALTGVTATLAGDGGPAGAVVLVGTASPASSGSPTASGGPAASGSPASPSANGSASPKRSGPSVPPSAGGSASAAPASPSPSAPGAATFSVPVPAGGYALLIPESGQYLAISRLTQPLLPGQSVQLTFQFDNGQTIVAPGVPVALPTAELPRVSNSAG